MNVVSIPSALRCEHGSLHLDAQPHAKSEQDQPAVMLDERTPRRRHADAAWCVSWIIPCCLQCQRESRWGAVTFDPRQPTDQPLLQTAAEHQDVPTSLDTQCSSHDGEQLHRLANRLLQQSTRGLQSAAIRQAATHLELHRSSHIRWQTRRPRHSSAVWQPALAPHQRANNIQVASAGV